MADPPQNRPGIQSVELAATILNAMAQAPGALLLRDIAAATAMPGGKVHRYLVSLTRSGLVEQDRITGRYGIGPLALNLGLAALGRIDVVRLASDALPGLRDAIDETAVLTVWANRGPTVIRLEESSHPVTINVRVGSVLPVLTTALGRVYAADMPPAQRDAVRAAHGPAWTRERTDAMLDEVRAQGLARVTGDLLPGISALAAPVRDHQGRVAAAVGAIGRQEAFDASWDGTVAAALREVTAALSVRMGYAA